MTETIRLRYQITNFYYEVYYVERFPLIQDKADNYF
jgi:hypothetical protein